MLNVVGDPLTHTVWGLAFGWTLIVFEEEILILLGFASKAKVKSKAALFKASNILVLIVKSII